MIEFRWLVKEREDKTWDDKWDEWRISVYKTQPILQYREHNQYTNPKHSPWMDIPTVVEEQ